MAVSACSPALDWREVRPKDAGVQAMFPCKPELNQRPAEHMGLAQCKAAGLSFALSWAEVPDPAQVGAALQQMRESLAHKLNARAQTAQAISVPGMTPNPEALTQILDGDGQQARVAVFTRGQRVYQAVMLGAKPDEAAWQSFVTSLKLIDDSAPR